MRFLTAGESHGPQLTAIIEGIPAGLEVSLEKINEDLARRQGVRSWWQNEDRERSCPNHLRYSTW